MYFLACQASSSQVHGPLRGYSVPKQCNEHKTSEGRGEDMSSALARIALPRWPCNLCCLVNIYWETMRRQGSVSKPPSFFICFWQWDCYWASTQDNFLTEARNTVGQRSGRRLQLFQFRLCITIFLVKRVKESGHVHHFAGLYRALQRSAKGAELRSNVVNPISKLAATGFR